MAVVGAVLGTCSGVSEVSKVHRNMLNELLADASDTMTEWEVRFVEGVSEWRGDLRPGQVENLEKIWTKVFG